MTQEAIQITETPPLPGLQLVQNLNKALETLGTDFAGPDDPAALAGPFMTWADTGNMLLKRRNAANTGWVTLGALFDFFYSRGSVVGTVTHSGETPTGALIQKGSNPNGYFWRFAGGLQVCVRYPFSVALSGASVGFTAAYPATFDSVLFSWGTINSDSAVWSTTQDRLKSKVDSRYLNADPARFDGVVSTGDGTAFTGSTGSVGIAAIGLRYN